MSLQLTAEDQTNETLILFELSRPIGVALDNRAYHLGLTRAQWHLLSVLRRNPGISQARIAELVELEPITISRQLERMEQQGLVRRNVDKRDRRAKQVFATEKAAEVMTPLRALGRELRKELLAGFTAKEHQALVGYLDRIRTNLAGILQRDAEEEENF